MHDPNPSPPPDSCGNATATLTPDLAATLAATMSEGLLLCDREGRVLCSNAAGQRILGVGTASLAGQSLADLCREAIRDDGSPLGPEHHPVSISLRTGGSQFGVVAGIRRPDGALTWIQINSQATHAADGTVSGAMMTFADITAVKTRELASRDAEQRWRLVMDSADQGGWDWDVVRGEINFSPRALRLMGLPEDGPAVRTVEESARRLQPGDAAGLRRNLRTLFRGKQARLRVEFRVRDTAGHHDRDLIARGAVVSRDSRGKALRLMGTVADITEVRRTELAALESERRFIGLAEASPLPIWVSGEGGARSYFNAAWSKLTGQTLEQSIDRGWRNAVHAEDRAELDTRTEAAYAARQPFTAEYRLKTRDGAYRRVLDQGYPRYSTHRELLGYVGTCIDIEDRHRSEQQVAKLSRAVEHADLSVVITDADGRIEYANPACCRRYGYRLDELVGRNPRIFKSSRSTPQTYAELWQTLTQGQTWRGTLRNLHRDGHEIWESVSISPVRDSRGRTTHYVGLKEDITERIHADQREREMSRRMARLERMQALSTLAGGVAHDFNNILVAILGFAELGEALLRASDQGQRVAGYLAEIRSAGERARNLVQRLLAAGRAGPMSLAPLSVAMLAEDMQALLAVSMPRHPVRVSAALDLPLIRADSDQMHQVLLNLLLNARDATPGGGELEIEIGVDPVTADLECAACQESFFGPHLRVRVRDHGLGLSAEARKHLFEPFFTTKEVGKGTGLGLPVVDGIVHRHGGHLCVTSVPDAGACFDIYLPIPEPIADLATASTGQAKETPRNCEGPGR